MLEDHERNVHTILKALCDTCLYINPEKTHLFCMEIDFLGHHISTKGIEADKNKVDHILNWPEPKNATEACGFLGLVCYLTSFLPSLAEHMGVLTELMTKEPEKLFLSWTPKYQIAFDAVKAIVTGRDCLTVIDFEKFPMHKIFVTTDASDKCSGGILLFGSDWETAHTSRRRCPYNTITIQIDNCPIALKATQMGPMLIQGIVR